MSGLGRFWVGGTGRCWLTRSGWARPVKGYASEAERFAKSRRRAQREARLADAAERLEQGRPRIVMGGGRLWRNRANLDQAQMTRAQWEARWTDGRMFLTADGEGGKRFGNETIRVTDDGVLQVKVPGALAADLGARLTITAPVIFDHAPGWAVG